MLGQFHQTVRNAKSLKPQSSISNSVFRNVGVILHIHRKTIIIRLALLLCLSLCAVYAMGIVGCVGVETPTITPKPQPTDTPSTSEILAPTQSPEVMVVPSPTFTPEPTPSHTPIPTVPPPTSTPAPTHTPVPPTPTTTPEPTATSKPSAIPTPTPTVVPASPDREVLVALYNATNGPNWLRSDRWLSDSPIGDWYGIITEEDRVVAISLPDNGLRGQIPAAIGMLANLTILDLEANQLFGPIPPEIGNLSRLTDLNLPGNSLRGEIPDSLGNLTNLELIALDGNDLYGYIPRRIGNLLNLTHLGLSENVLDGVIPPALGNLKNLAYLNLSYNRLSGEIPNAIGSLPVLDGLVLVGNRLTGKIPTELEELRLRELRISDNAFTGCLPEAFQELAQHSRLSNDLGDLRLPYRNKKDRTALGSALRRDGRLRLVRQPQLDDGRGRGRLVRRNHGPRRSRNQAGVKR